MHIYQSAEFGSGVFPGSDLENKLIRIDSTDYHTWLNPIKSIHICIVLLLRDVSVTGPLIEPLLIVRRTKYAGTLPLYQL